MSGAQHHAHAHKIHPCLNILEQEVKEMNVKPCVDFAQEIRYTSPSAAASGERVIPRDLLPNPHSNNMHFFKSPISEKQTPDFFLFPHTKQEFRDRKRRAIKHAIKFP